MTEAVMRFEGGGSFSDKVLVCGDAVNLVQDTILEWLGKFT